MSVSPHNPQHQAETEGNCDLIEIEGVALSPDDPTLEPRVRRGRPTDRQPSTPPQQDADDEPRMQSE